VIGSVHRHGTRWAPSTATGTRLGARAYPTRAEAAFQVVIHHQARHPPQKTRPHRRT